MSRFSNFLLVPLLLLVGLVLSPAASAVVTTTTINISDSGVSYKGKVQASVTTQAQEDIMLVKCGSREHTLECVNSVNDWYYRTTTGATDKILVKKDQVIDIPLNSGDNTIYIQRVSADGTISTWVTK